MPVWGDNDDDDSYLTFIAASYRAGLFHMLCCIIYLIFTIIL